MVDWNSAATKAHVLYALTALAWISAGVFGYDCCQHMSFDWSIIRGTRKRRWAHAPYMFAKVCYWTYLITCLAALLAETEVNCNGLMQAIEVQMGLVTVACSMLLAIRAICIYTGTQRKVIGGVVGVLTLGLLTAWMAGVKDVVAAWAPEARTPWTEGGCVLVHVAKRYFVKYIVTIAFDFIVMALTIVGIVRMNSNSRIGTVLIRQGAQYFLITFIANTFVAALTLANLNALMSLIGAIPTATIGVMCATRLFVNLSEEAKPTASGIYLFSTSTSRSEKIARFFTKSKTADNLFASAGETSTCGDLAVNALSYGNHKIAPLQAPRKSFGVASRDSDVEAQLSRTSLCIQITEKQVVTQEPMPAHLDGMLAPSNPQN